MDGHAVPDCGSNGRGPVGTLRRWLMFNAVGGMGVGVQLLTLGALADGLGLDYRLATALAVPAAVLHNFVWHEHWTWGDRCAGRRGRWARLGSFTLVNGTLSIAGNVLFTSLYVTAFDIHHVPANLLAIATCSVANFLASHHVVFRAAAKPAALAAALAAGNVAGLGAAELKDRTVAAWERYVAATERRIAGELATGERFLALDFTGDAAEARRKVLAGDVVVERMEARDAAGSSSSTRTPEGVASPSSSDCREPPRWQRRGPWKQARRSPLSSAVGSTPPPAWQARAQVWIASYTPSAAADTGGEHGPKRSP